MQNFTQISATDWRKQLQDNDNKTKIVIGLFLLIYIVIGLVIDLYIHPFPEGTTLEQALIYLVTFKIIPTATIIIGLAAVISILISYAFHDKIIMMGTDYKEINPKTENSLEERQFYNVIEELKIAAGMHYMPKVFIIEAPYMNAFASGYSEKSALVAITRGLMQKLSRSELQAVMAHELSHIRHHDIKLTMAASIMCNILLIAIDIIFRSVIYGGLMRNRDNRSEKRDSGGDGFMAGITIAIIVLRFVLPILTAILMLFLSRTREFMADAGAVELTRDNTPLANALLKIQGDYNQNATEYTELYKNTPHENIRHAAYIFEPEGARFSFASLFSTHPTLQARLKALGFSLPTKK